MSTAPEPKRSPSYREVGAGIVLASASLSSSYWWFGFSPFNNILWHLMKRVLGWEKNSSNVFFCSFFYIFRFLPLWSPSSNGERGICVIWVLNCYCRVCGVLSWVLALALWLFVCVYHFSWHSSFNAFSSNEFSLTKKELTTEYAHDNMLGNLGPEKWMVLPEDHIDPVFWEWSKLF